MTWRLASILAEHPGTGQLMVGAAESFCWPANDDEKLVAVSVMLDVAMLVLRDLSRLDNDAAAELGEAARVGKNVMSW
jgi:hypothetical protein